MSEQFANADEALDCVHGAGVTAGLLGSAKPGVVTQAALLRADRAREWLRAAVRYAEDRGYPDARMETRDEIAAGSVEYGTLMRESRHLDEATRRNYRNYCRGAMEATALVLRAAPSELAHELALMDAERGGQ